MDIKVTTLDGKAGESVALPEEIFGLEPRADILQRIVRWQLSKRQAGTHKTKKRGEIRMTSAKAYKQKGTGRARHGNKAAPQFRGGGKAFGPEPRSHAHGLPKKVRALALKHALSDKVRDEKLIVLSEAILSEPKTKALAAQLAGLGLSNALIVDGAALEDNFRLAARNIPQIDVLPIQGINVYDIMRRDTLVLTKAAVDALTERFK
ncbi:50S ribosomal protein L4 [Bauldia litoralis]|uniref:50S ribosomal protein L4 n=1 Tax=Bauldia litoralis TaxID=665467 RepID=UPI003265BF3B